MTIEYTWILGPLEVRLDDAQLPCSMTNVVWRLRGKLKQSIADQIETLKNPVAATLNPPR